MQPINRISLLFLLSLPIFFGTARASDGWKWNSRTDLSFVQDNNVLESVTGAVSDITARIFADINGARQLSPSASLSFDYKGGAEAYKAYTSENRMIHDLSTRFLLGILPNLSVGLSLQTRTKTFFQAKRGYILLQGAPSLRWKLGTGSRASLFAAYTFLDYADGAVFDFRRLNAGIRYDLALSSRATWSIQALLGRIAYRRNALDYRPLAEDLYQWIILDADQRDTIREISSTLEFYYVALIRCIGAYQWIASNSYGYSHTRPKLQVIAAKTFPWSLTLRVYWSLNLKNYGDSLQPILQVSPDTETEENSYLLIDLIKDLKDDFSLRLRLGVYRNESPFRDLYYEKTLLSLGLSKRF